MLGIAITEYISGILDYDVGLRLFKLAGRPTKEQFLVVYGKRGHLMTWTQRAEAGIPAEKFQAALAKQARR